MKINRLLRTLLLGAIIALGNGHAARAASIPWTGSLAIDFTQTGGTSISLPTLFGPSVTINGGSGVLTPVTKLSFATQFFGYVSTPAVSEFGNYGLQPYFSGFGAVAMASLGASAPGTCNGGLSSFANCPGGGLAGFGAVYGLRHLGIVGPQYVAVVGGGGYAGLTSTPASQYAIGAGWTTGQVQAFGSVYLPYFPTSNGPRSVTSTGGVSGSTISLVSPLVIYNYYNNSPDAYIIEPGIARLTINLTTACGNSLIEPGETCDDGGVAAGDGCSATCQVETGFNCTGAPSTCTAICGDGLILGAETCDDGGVAAGDGCSATCQVEAGYVCTGAPSECFKAVGVAGLKLIVVDKLTASSSAKAVFVAKDAAITKGTGTNTSTIGVTLDFTYDNGSDTPSAGQFVASAGSSNWLVNKDTVAKYVNKTAPTGGGTKVTVIKPGNLVKLVGKSLGDTSIDIFNQGAATTGVSRTAYCIDNGADPTTCFCSAFGTCSWKKIAADTGAKLVCRTGASDATCAAHP